MKYIHAVRVGWCVFGRTTFSALEPYGQDRCCQRITPCVSRLHSTEVARKRSRSAVVRHFCRQKITAREIWFLHTIGVAAVRAVCIKTQIINQNYFFPTTPSSRPCLLQLAIASRDDRPGRHLLLLLCRFFCVNRNQANPWCP